MQQLGPDLVAGIFSKRYSFQQSIAPNTVLDFNNETDVTITVSIDGRPYSQAATSSVRYPLRGDETSITVSSTVAPASATASINGVVYTVQDLPPETIARGATAANILPITTAELADGAVTTAKIEAAAVTTTRIAAGAVTSIKTALAAIDPTAGGLTIDSVYTGALQNVAVASGKIADAAVILAKLADGSVSTPKIQNAAITNVLIGNAAVDTAQIANAAITTALIANAAITTALIANAAITNALIANAAIDDAKISSVSAGKITAGTITATISINSPTITGGTYRTDVSPNRRIEISTTAGTELIQFFSGNVSETSPGRIEVGTAGEVIIQSARISGAAAVTLQLSPSAGPLLTSPTETQPALNSPWTEVHATSYIKTAQNVVILTGTVTGGSYPSTLFTLPGGYRPFAFRRFAVASATTSGTGYIDVDTSGNVIASAGSGYISLDGVVFGPGPGIPA